MICVSLSATTNAGMLDRLRKAAGQPVDLYELRLDALEEEPEIEKLMAAARRPVIATCRARAAGGQCDREPAERRDILLRAADAGARYVNADPGDVPDLAPHLEDAILIASLVDPRKTPENLGHRLHELATLPADWISFAVMVRRPSDNLAIFEAIASAPKPCIGVGMGEAGLMTRILNLSFGSKVTYGSLETGLETAPGQPTARDLAELYRVRAIGEKTQIYGLLGNPVSYSRFTRLHNRALGELDLDAVFIPFHAENAETFLNTIPQTIDLRGLSVITPHKRTALSWAESASEVARRIGAANTLTHRPDGWRADNSDCIALFEALKHCTDEAGISLTGAPTLVIGSGATARAIGVAFTLLGCRVTVAGRREERARRMAWDMNWEVEDLAEAGLGNWRAVGNGTPVGMEPDIDSTPFPASGWRRGMFAFDAVHRPRETRFMREARQAGALVMDLEEMLSRQAAGQFKMWTGLTMPDIVERGD